jgi:lactate dehydrogenase-like 2-hydroxyacid dehydrogenase
MAERLMKPKILVTREVFDETLAYLSQHCDIESNQQDVPLAAADLSRRVADKDALLCCLTDRIDAPLIGAGQRLKVVANIAVGYNNIDVAACSARGVLVTNTPGVLNDSTADFAFALVLAAARRIAELDARVRRGEWTGWMLKQWMGVDVHGATLGIIGMGRIGQVIARRASGFDMKILYCDPNPLDRDLEARLKATRTDKDTLLAQSDFVVLQVLYLPETHHLIGAAELARMKPSAILVNSSRGGVVDDAALAEALKAGRLRGAALDVYEGEPRVHPGLLELGNVVLAPHVASSTEATRRSMAMTAARNLVDALGGRTPPNLVNPEALPNKH